MPLVSEAPCARNFLVKALSCSTIAAGLLLFSSPSQAQMTPPGNDVAPPIPGAGHDYIHMLAETVNPANGSLNIKVDLPTPSGRGFSLPYSITYNSGSTHHLISGEPGVAQFVQDSTTTRTSGGWGDTLPYAAASFWNVGTPAPAHNTGFCTLGSNYVFYDPGGGSHPLGLSNISYFANSSGGSVDPGYCSTLGHNYMTGGDVEVTAKSFANCNGQPGSAGALLSCNNASAPFTVTDKEGTVYTFPYLLSADPGVGNNAQVKFEYPYTIEDRNGNIFSNTQPNTMTPDFVDTLGRHLLRVASGSGTSSIYSVGGLDYTVTTTTATANFVAPSAPPHIEPQNSSVTCGASFIVPNGGSGPGTIPDNGTATVIQSITLPNGKQYNFLYDSEFGVVNEIDYPDGGWVKYTWDFNDTFSDLIQYVGSNGSGPSAHCFIKYSTPVIRSRKVGFTPGVTALTQTFTYYTDWQDYYSWDYKTTTVTTLDQVTGRSTATAYTYGSVPSPTGGNPTSDPTALPAQAPVEIGIQYYPWNITPSKDATPVRTVNKTWNNPYQMSSVQTIDNGVSTETVYCYAGSLLNEEDLYDYGVSAPSLTQGNPHNYNPPASCANSTPSRKTIYSPQGFSGAPIAPQDPNYTLYGVVSSPGNGPGFIKPCQVVTYAADSSRAAETDLYYDGGSSLCDSSSGSAPVIAVTGLPSGTHDEVLFGSNGSNSRGNLSKIVKWSNTTAPSPTTNYHFDETGQVVSQIDPRSNTTLYSYADTGKTNAYLTKVTKPSTNGVTHVDQFAYRFVDGQLSSYTDENGQTTNYQYTDPMSRLTEIDYPPDPNNGNQRPSVVHSYDDSALSVTTTTTASPDPNVVQVSVRDGVGHVKQTQIGSSLTDMTYTGIGQLKSVSNPHFTTANATDGITSFVYDELGRKHYQCQPDSVLSDPTVCDPTAAGSIYLEWSFSGNLVTSYDESRNSWLRTYDAMGRLTNVTESGNLATGYTYSAIGDLTKVSQNGNPTPSATNPNGDIPAIRRFNYDSLGRLITSTNPETGMVCYGTWSSGSCVNGYDQNGNLTAKTDARSVTTNYNYDALNRLMSKTYANDLTGTPSSCFQYDTASGGIGKLAIRWTERGPCLSSPDAGALTKTVISAYDSMGRIKQEQQCHLANCTTRAPFTQMMNYDLAGNRTSYTNGIQTLIFGRVYDAAGRLQGVESSLGDISHPASLYSVTSFTPQGAVSSATVGLGIYVNNTYDSRLRFTGTTVAHP